MIKPTMKLKLIKWVKVVFVIFGVNAFILVGLAFSDAISDTHYVIQYSYLFVIPAGIFFIFGMCLVFILLIKKRIRPH